jgi:hypothetical protein
MALSFPPNPQIGDQYQAPNGTTYTWDGLRWNASSSSSGSSGGSSGGGAAIVFSNGTLVTSTATSLNFVGSVVTATSSGTAVSINIDIPATTSTFGVIKVGPNLTISNEGVLDSSPGNMRFWTEGTLIDANFTTDGSSIYSATGARENLNAVIATKGTGAHQGAASGEKRGAYATDWQKIQLTASQVASGDYAIIGGGSGNKADQLHSIVVGGNNNYADAPYSIIVGGKGGRANGIYGAVIFPGDASGNHQEPGASQAGKYILAAETFDNTITRLTTDGSVTPTAVNQLTLKDNTAMFVRGTVIAKEYQKYRGEVWSWTFEGAIRRDVGSTTTDFAPAGILPEIKLTPGVNTASNWLLALDIDNQVGALVVEVQGGSTQHIRWSCVLDTIEVSDVL